MRAWFAAATALQPPHPTPSLSIRFVAQAQRLSEKKAVPRNCDDAKPLVCASHQASEVPDSLPLKCCWLHVPPPASRHCDCSIALQERPLHHSTHALTGRELNFLLVTSPVATSRQAHAARGPGGAPGCASRACGALMCGLVRFGLAGGLERKGGPLGHVTPGSSRGRERSRRKKALLAVLCVQGPRPGGTILCVEDVRRRRPWRSQFRLVGPPARRTVCRLRVHQPYPCPGQHQPSPVPALYAPRSRCQPSHCQRAKGLIHKRRERGATVANSPGRSAPRNARGAHCHHRAGVDGHKR